MVLSTGWSPTEKRSQHQRHHLLLRNWDRVSCSWWQRRWCLGRRWTNNRVGVLCSYCWCCCWWCCRLPQLMVMIMISMTMLMINDDDQWRWVAVALKISWVSLAFAWKTLPTWSPESELLMWYDGKPWMMNEEKGMLTLLNRNSGYTHNDVKVNIDNISALQSQSWW